MPKKQSKSTKKSPRKLDRVIKKLNLARPRNQFIVAFLVVGLIGGGWMAYQSFATSSNLFNIHAANITSKGGGATKTSDTLQSAGKNGMMVAALPDSNSWVELTSFDYLIPTESSRSYRMCFTARTEGSLSSAQIRSTVTKKDNTNPITNWYTSLPSKDHLVSLRSPNTYAKYCSNKFTGSGSAKSGYNSIHFKIEHPANSAYNGRVLIGLVLLDQCFDATC